MLISQSGLSAVQQAMRRREVSMRDLRLLLEMLANTGHENLVMVSQIDLERLTGMDESAVSKSVRALRGVGFIERVQGRRGFYRITPDLVWKGSGDAHRDAIARKAEEAYFEKYAELERLQGKEVA